MPVTTAVPDSVSTESIDTDQTTIEWFAMEFEYPVAVDPDRVPASPAVTSGELREDYREDAGTSSWYLDGLPAGRMGRDHTGAEITPPPLHLHSTQPEEWYAKTIQQAESYGYPFAACGRHNSTNFGLHFNLSPVPEDTARALYDMLSEDWARVFFCASVNDTGADPFRYGGVRSSTLDGSEGFEGDYGLHTCSDSRTEYDSTAGDYYEFRLPEPGVPEHVNMMVEFIRVLDVEGPEAAEEYASEIVYDADDRLTPVQQYEILSDDPTWYDTAFDDVSANDPAAAEFMAEIMGDL